MFKIDEGAGHIDVINRRQEVVNLWALCLVIPRYRPLSSRLTAIPQLILTLPNPHLQ